MDSENEHEFDIPSVEITETDIVPDTIINTVQSKRLGMLLTNQIPDKDTMALMRDLSNTAINQKRISVDKETAEGEREAAALMATAISQIGNNPFKREVIEGVCQTTMESSFKPAELPDITPVPGETSQEMEEVVLEK